MSRYSSQLQTWSLVLVLVSVLSFLFVMSRSVEFESYSRAQFTLQQIQLLDAQINENVLNAYRQQYHNYDGLVAITKSITEALERLAWHESADHDHFAIQRGIDQLRAEVLGKLELLETFKSANAIHKNSLAFTPKAIANLLAEAQRDQAGSGAKAAFSGNAHGMLHAFLIYNLNNDPSFLEQTSSYMDALMQQSDLSPSVSQVMSGVLFHLRISIDNKRSLENLIARLLETPISARTRELEQAYLAHQQAATTTVAKYRLAMFGFSALLLLALGWILFQYRRQDRQLRKLSSAVQQTADIVFITDRQGIIKYVNNAFETVTGYTKQEAIGVSPSILSSGKHDRAFYAELWNTIMQGESFWSLFINRKKSGELYYEEKTITPVRENGEIVAFVCTGKDITERIQNQEQLNHLVYHDLLTGLPNRSLLVERLNHAIAQAHRNTTLVAVAFLDIDQFKLINDSLGHSTGDSLIKLVAQRLTLCLREGDAVARMGGDEFIVLIENLSEIQHASDTVERILATLEQPFALPDGRELHITASIGIATYPMDGDSDEQLLKHADAALHQAKREGQGLFRYFTAAMNEQTLWRLEIIEELRLALEQNQFRLHYQPQVDLRSGKIIAVEALLRWQHPERGLLSPFHFIEVLEQSPLMPAVGGWILRTACAQNKAWQDAGYPPICMGVNVSARQFEQANLARLIADALKQTGLNPRHLEIEITESLMMKDMESYIGILNEVKAMGVRIALDDFGTGYSSLSYVKRFPIDKIKIDKSFVDDILADPDDAAIACAIISMAHSLELTTMAEGIETEAQLNYLRAQQCDGMQGYFFCRPLPAEQLEALFKEGKQLIFLEPNAHSQKETAVLTEDA